MRWIGCWKRRSPPRGDGKYTNVQYARFADDLVILIDAHPRHGWLVKAVERRLREELAKLRVEINEDKSRMVDLAKGESFSFLGFEYRRIRSRNAGVATLLCAEAEEADGAVRKAQGDLPTQRQPACGKSDRDDQPDPAGVGELLSDRRFESMFLDGQTTG